MITIIAKTNTYDMSFLFPLWLESLEYRHLIALHVIELLNGIPFIYLQSNAIESSW